MTLTSGRHPITNGSGSPSAKRHTTANACQVLPDDLNERNTINTPDLKTMHRDSMRSWAHQYRNLIRIGDEYFAAFALQMAKKHRDWAATEQREAA